MERYIEKNNVDRDQKRTLELLDRLDEGVCLGCGRGTTPELGIFCSLNCKHSFGNAYLEELNRVHDLGKRFSTIDYTNRYYQAGGEYRDSVERRKIDYVKLFDLLDNLQPIEIENLMKSGKDFDMFQ